MMGVTPTSVNDQGETVVVEHGVVDQNLAGLRVVATVVAPSNWWAMR